MIPLSRVLEALIQKAIDDHHIGTGAGVRLAREQLTQTEIPWEVFRGRLLPATQTRQRRSLEAWNVYLIVDGTRSGGPVLSVKLDRERGELHVTRAIECHVWEPYDTGGNVIESREVQRWVPELVGTIALAEFPDFEDLREELHALLFHAVVGCSRLPLTSVEAPLPAFTLGQLTYFLGVFFRRSLLDLPKVWEFILRTEHGPTVEGKADGLMNYWMKLGHSPAEVLERYRTMFNEVTLSPYTDFVDNALALLQAWVKLGHLTPADLVDFLSYLLRQLGRHLTAYDLITFHHRGANYPDALVLDAALKLYLEWMEKQPNLFLDTDARLRRRALRQAWLLRRFYEGLPVPDMPVSPGENVRVLPPPFVRVPEEQILDPTKRRKRLYENDPITDRLGPIAGEVLRKSMEDLAHPAELRELGLGLFLNRPFGYGKEPGEPDQTLLLSHEAFSLSVAERRLHYLHETLGLFPNPAAFESTLARLRQHAPRGIPLPPGPRVHRPGGVMLRDAERAAPDFVFLRTTRQAVEAFLQEFDFSALRERMLLDFLSPGQRVLLFTDELNAPEVLCVYDAELQKCLELRVDLSEGYRRRRGREFPAAGLQAVPFSGEPKATRVPSAQTGSPTAPR